MNTNIFQSIPELLEEEDSLIYIIIKAILKRQPTESDIAHCNKRLIVGGTNYYLEYKKEILGKIVLDSNGLSFLPEKKFESLFQKKKQ